MKEFLEKLSSYNLLNYLIPGAVFVALGRQITKFDLMQSDVILALCTYYFIGMVISRIGSHLLEPLLKKLKLVSFAPYGEYVRASAEDKQLAELSEQNNMYRTMAAMFLSLIVLKTVEMTCDYWNVSGGVLALILVPALFVLFVLSFRKQTTFIAKRVGVNKDVRNS